MQHNHPIFSMNGKICRMKHHDGEKHPKWCFFYGAKIFASCDFILYLCAFYIEYINNQIYEYRTG